MNIKFFPYLMKQKILTIILIVNRITNTPIKTPSAMPLFDISLVLLVIDGITEAEVCTDTVLLDEK